MTEKYEPIEEHSSTELSTSNPELVTESAAIMRIIAGEDNPDTGEVFAEMLFNDDVSPEGAEDPDEEIVSPLIAFDPQQFPDDIRTDILAGKPFRVTSLQIQSPEQPYSVDFIDIFSLVEE